MQRLFEMNVSLSQNRRPSVLIVLSLVLAVSIFLLMTTHSLPKPSLLAQQNSITDPEPTLDDVNLVTGHVASPEDDERMARSKMLGDFQAR